MGAFLNQGQVARERISLAHADKIAQIFFLLHVGELRDHPVPWIAYKTEAITPRESFLSHSIPDLVGEQMLQTAGLVSVVVALDHALPEVGFCPWAGPKHVFDATAAGFGDMDENAVQRLGDHARILESGTRIAM